jgi:osmoprotectant transport system permease protein
VILVRNIVAGLDGVSDDVLEAANGMGHTRRQRLWRVELPLAVPLIVAGLRLATVSTIGLVTITGTISDAFGGLGYFILDGYHRTFPTEMYAGALPSILLALAVDLLFVRLQRRVTPWAHARALEAAA